MDYSAYGDLITWKSQYQLILLDPKFSRWATFRLDLWYLLFVWLFRLWSLFLSSFGSKCLHNVCDEIKFLALFDALFEIQDFLSLDMRQHEIDIFSFMSFLIRWKLHSMRNNHSQCEPFTWNFSSLRHRLGIVLIGQKIGDTKVLLVHWEKVDFVYYKKSICCDAF